MVGQSGNPTGTELMRSKLASFQSCHVVPGQNSESLGGMGEFLPRLTFLDHLLYLYICHPAPW